MEIFKGNDGTELKVAKAHKPFIFDVGMGARDGEITLRVKGIAFRKAGHKSVNHTISGNPVDLRRELRMADACECDYCTGNSCIEDMSTPAMGKIEASEPPHVKQGFGLFYMPYPKTLTNEYVDYEVIYGLNDPNLDKEYGTLNSVDTEGNVWVTFGKGKPKKCAAAEVELCTIQHKHKIMFLTQSFFRNVDPSASVEDQQQQVRRDYNEVLRHTTGGEGRKRDPFAKLNSKTNHKVASKKKTTKRRSKKKAAAKAEPKKPEAAKPRQPTTKTTTKPRGSAMLGVKREL